MPRDESPGAPTTLSADRSAPSPPAALARLPVGRHRLPRAFIEENHRSRIVAAAIDVFSERGFQGTSIEQLVKGAGVSRNTFYALYEEKAACFVSARQIVIEWLEAEALRSAEGEDEWPGKVRAATARVLELLAEDPRFARICTVEVLAAGPDALAAHHELIDRLGAALRRGREEAGNGGALPALLEQVLLGGVISLIARNVADGKTAGLAGLAPQVSEILLSPYLGWEDR
jgi:AcrR family transcriptional regulator